MAWNLSRFNLFHRPSRPLAAHHSGCHISYVSIFYIRADEIVQVLASQFLECWQAPFRHAVAGTAFSADFCRSLLIAECWMLPSFFQANPFRASSSGIFFLENRSWQPWAHLLEIGRLRWTLKEWSEQTNCADNDKEPK
jgi:hypothetical protein